MYDELSLYNKDPDFEALVRGKRIAIVGPAPHVVGSGMGGLIDSYDIVCRPNQIAVMPRDQVCDYGRRTDVLFACGNRICRDLIEKDLRINGDFVRHLKHFVCPEEFEEDDVNQNRKKFYELCINSNIPGHQVCRDYMLYLIDKIGAFPNTGLLGIIVLLQYPIEELFIAGMSFFNMGGGGKVYYSKYHQNQFSLGILPPRIKELQDKPTMEQQPQIEFFQQLLKTSSDIVKVDSYLAENFEVEANQEIVGYSAKAGSVADNPSSASGNSVLVSDESGLMKPLTIFSLPEAFEGKKSICQRNALQSWMQLKPRPEIILFGDNRGVGEFAAEFGLRHIPDVNRNQYGTPLVDDIFEKAQLHASNDLLMYINSDVVLLSDFMRAVQQSFGRFEEFLMIGRRWEADIAEEIEFDNPAWEKDLRQFVYMDGFKGSDAMDYLVFTRDFWSEIPSLGMSGNLWGNWLAGQVIEDCKVSIDATDMVMAVHQGHKNVCNSEGDDAANLRLAGDKVALGAISSVTWKLTPAGIVVRPASEHLVSTDFRTALKYFNHAWELHCRRVENQFRYVMENVQSRRLPELVEAAQNLLVEQPDNEAAIFVLRKFDEIEFDQAVDFFKKGIGYLMHGRAPDALACLRRATTGPHCFPEVFYATAVAFVLLGNLPAAAKECRKEIASYPNADHATVEKLLEQIKDKV